MERETEDVACGEEVWPVMQVGDYVVGRLGGEEGKKGRR